MADPRKKRKGRAVRILVSGVVQGVGFRPFIYRLAVRFGFHGYVKNVGPGVEIHLEQEGPSDFESFLRAVRREKPPLGLVEEIKSYPTPFKGFRNFRVLASRREESFAFISPDIGTCSACLAEISDPAERRYRYPFTNCTDCGPRYTIVRSLPYDRSRTTMAGFALCPDCRREYHDPLDRRYQAQPIACPLCGPRVTLTDSRTGKTIAGGLDEAASLLKKGKILAVKGLGGFHLAVDALNPAAVRRLRRVKKRKTKPLALMAASPEVVEKYVYLSEPEKHLLLSASRPIVLLKKKKDIPGLAPHLDEMGFMLPYTPLHHLLLRALPLIVATSSNRKDSPIMKDRKEGIAALSDAVLDHDRPIEMRADDSVLRVVRGRPLFVRRARGYVPYPQKVPASLVSSKHILALGGELKDTVSIYKNGYVVTSQFLGDLDEYRNHRYLEETIGHLCRLFSVKPEVVVCDLHPDFHTTRMARRMGLPLLQVQHHHAHILAALLEHGFPAGRKVLGVSLDGYGYGVDGEAWGGEFMVADYSSSERFGRLKPVPLPGGDLAARQPWRMALAYLGQIYGDRAARHKSLERVDKKKVQGVLAMTSRGVRSPLASSCGRLFDAVSWLTGLAPEEMEFEAEAAMRLEAAAAPKSGRSYPFRVLPGRPFDISFVPTIRAILQDLEARRPVPDISARFHQTLARAIVRMAELARVRRGITTVALTGGVFLNKRLLEASLELLQKKRFKVLRPEHYSPNDESLSLGQIAFALNRLKRTGL
jgi:hydrogenase maturation protein HypF